MTGAVCRGTRADTIWPGILARMKYLAKCESRPHRPCVATVLADVMLGIRLPPSDEVLTGTV